MLSSWAGVMDAYPQPLSPRTRRVRTLLRQADLLQEAADARRAEADELLNAPTTPATMQSPAQPASAAPADSAFFSGLGQQPAGSVAAEQFKFSPRPWRASTDAEIVELLKWHCAGVRLVEDSTCDCSEALASYLNKRHELKAEHFGQYVALQQDGTYILTGKDGPVEQYLGFIATAPGGTWLKIGFELGQEEPR